MRKPVFQKDEKKLGAVEAPFFRAPDRYYVSVFILAMTLASVYIPAAGRLRCVDGNPGFTDNEKGAQLFRDRHMAYLSASRTARTADMDVADRIRAGFDHLPGFIRRIRETYLSPCGVRANIPAHKLHQTVQFFIPETFR